MPNLITGNFRPASELFPHSTPKFFLSVKTRKNSYYAHLIVDKPPISAIITLASPKGSVKYARVLEQVDRHV